MVSVQRPQGVDVSVFNPNEIVYVKGNESTDGSIRLVPDTSAGTEVEFQLRASGVWNDTGIQIAASTIFLGRDLEVKGAGDWILTTDVQEDHRALIPHIEFTDELGTDQSAHVPVLSPLINDVPIQPDFSQEIITALYNKSQINPAELLAKTVKYKTGSLAATEPVRVSFSRPPGVSFWSRNFSASTFGANLDVTIDLLGLVEGFPGESIITTITSDANFSLLGDSSGEAYTLLSFYLLTEEDAITSTTGMDRVLINQVGGTLADISGNLILDGTSP